MVFLTFHDLRSWNNFFLGFRHTLLPERTCSMYENSEMTWHKELILTPTSLQLLQVQISRALLRDS